MNRLGDLVGPGITVAIADGGTTPFDLLADLSAAARVSGDVRLLLGWCTHSLDDLDLATFADVCALTGGYRLRRPIEAGAVRQIPARLGTWPALIADVLRPELLLTSVVRYSDGYRFAGDPAWQWSVVDAGAKVVAIERTGPHCVAGPSLPAGRLTVLGPGSRDPEPFAWTEPDSCHHEIAARVATALPSGARLQFAPGALGAALIAALQHPVQIDTGVLTDAVVTLDRLGLLNGPPRAPYAIGGEELKAWMVDRPVLDRIEVTHDPGRLRSGSPLFAVNTALEVDLDGQVNIESVDGRPVGAVGGQPDFMAAAAAAPGGLSIVALPTVHAGRSTLVERLTAPASTPAHDVDVIVTERGSADLRGRDRAERRKLIGGLWP